MRLGRCRISGHVVSTASSTPASAASASSALPSLGDGAQRAGLRACGRAAAVVGHHHVVRIVRIDPEVVMITVGGVADVRQRLAAVDRAERARVQHVDDVASFDLAAVRRRQ